jgi:cellulose synthase/poly-beta-1,6-N-acetylglucosamine synthase-like glycosyltransferase
MTGIVAAGSVFSLLFGLFLGRWWQANLYNPGGFKQEYLSLETKPRLTIGSSVVVAVALLSSGELSEIAWNISILLFVLFTVTGTAVLHTFFSGMKMSRYTVPMFYITLFLIPHAMLLVALIGLSDPWLNLRKKKSN